MIPDDDSIHTTSTKNDNGIECFSFVLTRQESKPLTERYTPKLKDIATFQNEVAGGIVIKFIVSQNIYSKIKCRFLFLCLKSSFNAGNNIYITIIAVTNHVPRPTIALLGIFNQSKNSPNPK